MTPEMALDNLDQVAADFKGSRSEHDALRESVQVLQMLIESCHRSEMKKVVSEVQDAKN